MCVENEICRTHKSITVHSGSSIFPSHCAHTGRNDNELCRNLPSHLPQTEGIVLGWMKETRAIIKNMGNWYTIKTITKGLSSVDVRLNYII